MELVVYKVTNLINGKLYIGKTRIGINARWKRHCYSGQCPRLRAAIDKYGKEAFKIEVIEKCKDYKELNKRERFWIAYYDTTHTGYNVLEGGNEIPALHHTHLTLEQEQMIMKMKEDEYTSVQICQKFKVVPQTVASVFKKHNKKLHYKCEKLIDRLSPIEFTDFIYTHPTLLEVEKKFKISKAGVYKFMKMLQLPFSCLTSERAIMHIDYMERYSDQVMNLHNQGISNRKISKLIGIARQTVAKIIEYNISKSVRHPE